MVPMDGVQIKRLIVGARPRTYCALIFCLTPLAMHNHHAVGNIPQSSGPKVKGSWSHHLD